MRVENWPLLLAEYFDQAQKLTFEWGKSDCVLWCAEWIRRSIGRDLTKGISIQYSDDRGAREALLRMRHADTSSLASAFLPEIPIARAQRGDVILYPDGTTLGISLGRKAMFLTHEGATETETLNCKRAWKVE